MMNWLFRRTGNFFEWRTADRCLLAALINLAFLLLYNAASLYYFAHPEIADYVNLPAAQLLYQLEVLFILGWAKKSHPGARHLPSLRDRGRDIFLLLW